MLTKFGFVSPSELADFKHFHLHRNQQRDSRAYRLMPVLCVKAPDGLL